MEYYWRKLRRNSKRKKSVKSYIESRVSIPNNNNNNNTSIEPSETNHQSNSNSKFAQKLENLKNYLTFYLYVSDVAEEETEIVISQYNIKQKSVYKLTLAKS